MTYPAGVTTIEVTSSGYLDMFGDDRKIQVRVRPYFGESMERIIWSATGEVLNGIYRTFTAKGAPVTFTVPVTDQAGWTDGSGSAFSGWAYEAVTTVFGPDGKAHASWRQMFQPVTADGATFDLDEVPDSTYGSVTLPPVSVPIPGPSAYEVAVADGFVGTEEEWLESLVGAPGGSDASFAGWVGDTTPSATRTALATMFAAGRALTRRDQMLRAVSFGAVRGGGCLYYRHADDVRLLRALGDGYYSEYFWRRTSTAANTGGTKSLVFTAANIGVPMLAAPAYHGGASGTVTYNGTWTTVGVNSGNTKMEAWEGFGREAVTLTWSGSGASMTVVGTALENAPTKYINRWITIPGVGAGGVDAFVKITNLTSSGAAVSFSAAGGVAAAAAFTAVASVIDPGKRQSQVVGDYAEWVSPTTTELGVIAGINANAPLVECTINAGAIVPNLLPTAQQLVNDGRIPASALTTGGGSISPTARILDPYGPNTLWGLPIGLAKGLPSAAYTVRLTLLSAKNVASATSGTLFTVAGWGYGTDTAVNASGVATPSSGLVGAELFASYRVGRFFSNNELAIDTQFSGGSSSFIGGEGHGYESQTQAPVWMVDGTVITPVAGTRYMAAGEVVMRRKASVYHPSDTAAPSWLYETTYRADALPGLTINQRATAARDLTIASAGYLVNWDVYPTKLQGNYTDTAYTALGVADGTYINSDKHDTLAWWDENLGSGAVAVLEAPDAKRQTGGWSSTQKVTIRKLSGAGVGGASVGYAHTKGYVQLPGGAITSGTVLTGEGRYIVGRDPNTVPQLPAVT